MKKTTNRILVGVILLILGILLPGILTIELFDIYKFFLRAIEGNTLALILGSLGVVFLNAARTFPLYIGAFLIAEGLDERRSKYVNGFTKSIFIIFTVISTCYIRNKLHNMEYQLGIPAISTMILIGLIGNAQYNHVSQWKKTLLIMLIVTSLQFIEIMPIIKSKIIGRGEMAREIEQIRVFLNLSYELNIITISIVTIFIIFSLVVFLMIRDENKLRKYDDLKSKAVTYKRDRELERLKTRTNNELRYLVHDLKSPLTSAQALISLVSDSLDKEHMAEEIEYLRSSEKSLNSLNEMITELLDHNYQSTISVSKCVRAAMANVSTIVPPNCISYNNISKTDLVKGNRIMFIRAIANLLINSYSSFADDKGQIVVYIENNTIEKDKFIKITIIDTGSGITDNEIPKIWDLGYSSKESHGLGLNFVKEVINNMNGTIYLNSKYGVGTTITMLLKEVIDDKNLVH